MKCMCQKTAIGACILGGTCLTWADLPQENGIFNLLL